MRLGSRSAQQVARSIHHCTLKQLPSASLLSREYIQPQWVLDSANFRVLVPTDLYAPGRLPPPHLSPFVNNEEEGYTPDYANVIKSLQSAAEVARGRGLGSGEEGFIGEEGGLLMPLPGGDEAAALQEREEQYIKELEAEIKGVDPALEPAGASKPLADGSDDEKEEEEEQDDDEEEEEEEEEAPVVPVSAGKRKRAGAEVEDEEEEKRMRSIMMTRKSKKLYEVVKKSQQKKVDRASELQRKKEQIQKAETKRPKRN